MASIQTLMRLFECRSAGCIDLILLKCTSSYPATPASANISTIPHMKELYGCEVGLSDHSMGIGVAVAAVALCASVIEKHFTISRDDGGVDSSFSLEPPELSALVIETFRAWQSIGKIKYGPTESEISNLAHRRSIYVSSDICEGDIFTSSNIKIVRPGDGADPALYPLLIGKQSRRSYKRGTPLSLEQLL